MRARDGDAPTGRHVRWSKVAAVLNAPLTPNAADCLTDVTEHLRPPLIALLLARGINIAERTYANARTLSVLTDKMVPRLGIPVYYDDLVFKF